MPSNCYECDYCGYATIDSNEGNEYKYRSCALSQRYLGEIEENYKDSLCPLKPMPRKKYSLMCGDSDGNRWKEPSEYDIGYNDCVDEILGEE